MILILLMKFMENSLTSNPPARETVEVSRLPKDVNIEISIIACK